MGKGSIFSGGLAPLQTPRKRQMQLHTRKKGRDIKVEESYLFCQFERRSSNCGCSLRLHLPCNHQQIRNCIYASWFLPLQTPSTKDNQDGSSSNGTRGLHKAVLEVKLLGLNKFQNGFKINRIFVFFAQNIILLQNQIVEFLTMKNAQHFSKCYADTNHLKFDIRRPFQC